MKKIALVIPSLHAGGMERVMSELASYFALKESVEIHLVLYGIKPMLFYPIADRVIIHMPSIEFDNTRRVKSSIGRLWFLRKEIKKIKPDTILSFGDLWNSFVLLALIGTRYPVYISDRCQPDKKISVFYDIIRRVLYPRTEGIIAQTEKAKCIYEKYFGHKNITVIGNPIRQIASGDYAKKENIVISVGRLIPTKNHDQLIRLFAELNIPDWKLVIVGGDALNQKLSVQLNNLIDELNVRDKVVLTGVQSDVESYLQKSKIFAFTSSSEGFPNVIGEAMSAGLPVVAFDCMAGPSDMIEDNETGFLIPLFDYDDFGEKLERLMKDEDMQQKFGNRGKVSITRFSRDRIADSFYQFITSDK